MRHSETDTMTAPSDQTETTEHKSTSTLAHTHPLSHPKQVIPVAALLQPGALPGDVGGAQSPGVQVHTEGRERCDRKQRYRGRALHAATPQPLIANRLW